MGSYSKDLRHRVLMAMTSGQSADEAARRFDIHPTTARTWRRLAAAGQTVALKVGAKPVPTKLTADDLQRVRCEIEARPGATLRELATLLGNKVVQSTLCRALMKLGYRYKKSHWRRESNKEPTSSAAAPTSVWPGDLPMWASSSSLTKAVPGRT